MSGTRLTCALAWAAYSASAQSLIGIRLNPPVIIPSTTANVVIQVRVAGSPSRVTFESALKPGVETDMAIAAEVADSQIPRAAVTVDAPDVQHTDYLVNILMPQAFPAGDSARTRGHARGPCTSALGGRDNREVPVKAAPC